MTTTLAHLSGYEYHAPAELEEFVEKALVFLVIVGRCFFCSSLGSGLQCIKIGLDLGRYRGADAGEESQGSLVASAGLRQGPRQFWRCGPGVVRPGQR
jgi:hypothetical protein